MVYCRAKTKDGKECRYKTTIKGYCLTSGSYKPKSNIIMINSTSKHWSVHELCHAINEQLFNPRQCKKLGHNKQFWVLCYEFGLTEKDYGYGLTTAMKSALEVVMMNREFKIKEVI